MGKPAAKQDYAGFSKKRKYIRFPPDMNTLTRILLLDENGKPKGPEILGLAVDESYEGCSTVVRATDALQNNSPCIVVVGALEPLPGKIVWLRELEPGIVRVGIAINPV